MAKYRWNKPEITHNKYLPPSNAETTHKGIGFR
jgi:hypothetical protein